MMKKRLWALFLALLLVSMAACSPASVEEPRSPEQTTIEIPSEALVLTDMDLCAESSRYSMAETESGYYLSMGEKLYYADKADLTNWVVVCNTPDCDHSRANCPARVGMSFYLEDGRIWSVRDPRKMSDSEQLDLDVLECVGVYSMAMEGTGLRREYIMAESVVESGGWAFVLVPGKIYSTFSVMQTDGNYHNSIMVTDSTGTTVLKESTTQDRKEAIMGNGGIFGDLTLYSSLWDDNDFPILRHTENGLEEVPGLSALDTSTYGACLRGDTLLRFIPNDGYYRTNLKDGTSEKMMDAQLPDSRACCFDCGYIVEGNMFAGEPFDTPELQIYNGAQWKPVTLPEGLQLSPEDALSPHAISTEAIFFRRYRTIGTGDNRSMEAEMYVVPLNRDEYTMTFCGTFSMD